MMRTDHIASLFFKELQGRLSDDEAMELGQWKRDNQHLKEFFEQVDDEGKLDQLISEYHPENLVAIEEKIQSRIESRISFKVIPIHRNSFFRIAVAACIAVLMLVGGYLLFFTNKSAQDPIVKTPANKDVEAPQVTKAMIQLPDGRIIAIDSLSKISEGSLTIQKNANGEIVYSGSGSTVEYSTVINPKGSPVQHLTLIDGSKVWMNSQSSLKYFTNIRSGERRVEITGECYFEAAPDATRPFIVKDITRNAEVQVLGTHFNVNTYSDESVMKVTLLEGSVKVIKGQSSQIIKPGEQAQVAGEIKVSTNVNLDEVMAWKHGFFKYSSATLPELMRQAARWYDVDVVYAGKIPGDTYTGSLPRTVSLAKWLKVLEESGVKFSIEGKKLTVLP